MIYEVGVSRPQTEMDHIALLRSSPQELRRILAEAR